MSDLHRAGTTLRKGNASRLAGHASLRSPGVWLAILVLLVALGVAALSGDRLRYPDEEQYLAIATHLVEDGVFSLDGDRPTAFRPPGYPFLLAGFLFLGAGVLQLKMINSFALAVSTYLIFGFLDRVSGRPAALAGGALILAYPVLFYAASTLYPQTLGGTLLLLCLRLALFEGAGPRRILGAAVVYGLLILTIPGFALMLPIMAFGIYFFHREAMGLRVAAYFLAGAVLTVAPWTARNGFVFRAFVPLSTNSGLVLLRGNSEQARAGLGVNWDMSGYEATSRGMSEVERDRFYRQEAIKWISQNRKDACVLYVRKTAQHFSFREKLHIASEGSRLRELVMLLTYYPLLALSGARFLFARRRRMESWEIVAGLLYLGFALVSAVFFTRIRFRLPLDLVLILLAGPSLAWLIRRCRPVAISKPLHRA